MTITEKLTELSTADLKAIYDFRDTYCFSDVDREIVREEIESRIKDIFGPTNTKP